MQDHVALSISRPSLCSLLCLRFSRLTWIKLSRFTDWVVSREGFGCQLSYLHNPGTAFDLLCELMGLLGHAGSNSIWWIYR